MGKRGRISLSAPDTVLEKSRNATSQLLSVQDELVISKIVSHLSADPSRASRVLLMLESGQLDNKQSTGPSDKYHSQNKLRLIPREHMLEFLCQICPALSDELLASHRKPYETLGLALNMDPSSAVFTKHVHTIFRACKPGTKS